MNNRNIRAYLLALCVVAGAAYSAHADEKVAKFNTNVNGIAGNAGQPGDFVGPYDQYNSFRVHTKDEVDAISRGVNVSLQSHAARLSALEPLLERVKQLESDLKSASDKHDALSKRVDDLETRLKKVEVKPK